MSVSPGEASVVTAAVSATGAAGATASGEAVVAGDTLAAADEAFRRPLRRALVSVYDKTGLTELAAALHAAGVEIVSTGSTASVIAATGVPVTRVQVRVAVPAA